MAFLVSFAVIGLITIPVLAIVSGLDFGAVVIIVLLFINIWISSIMSRIFYVLPEWERLVLLKVGKFVGVKGPGYFVIPPFLYSVAAIVDIRIVTQQVEATATLTKDNVPTRWLLFTLQNSVELWASK